MMTEIIRESVLENGEGVERFCGAGGSNFTNAGNEDCACEEAIDKITMKNGENDLSESEAYFIGEEIGREEGNISGENNVCREAENGEGVSKGEDDRKNVGQAEAERRSAELFENHPIALTMVEEIAAEAAENGIEPKEAYVRALEKSFRERAALASDEEFLKTYIYGNDRIRDKIVGEYLESVARKGMPRVMSGKSASFVTPPDRVSSMAAAKELVRKMASRRG